MDGLIPVATSTLPRHVHFSAKRATTRHTARCSSVAGTQPGMLTPALCVQVSAGWGSMSAKHLACTFVCKVKAEIVKMKPPR